MRAPFYVLPAIRGIQAQREYYVSMCPLRLIPKIILPNEQELPPELRVQRVLNKARIPEIVRYMVGNPTDYVLSALTVSVNSEVTFVSISSDPYFYDIGHLHIPMSAQFILNDGQHRWAAIEVALRERPELGDETLALVLFIDEGLKRSQQTFADLNRYSVRPTQSLNILYDHRDQFSQLIRALVQSVPVFTGLTEMEKSTISNSSPKLFTLSGIYRATKELLAGHMQIPANQQLELARSFWSEVSHYLKDWMAVKNRQVSAAELRKDYVHAHTVTLVAIGRAGRALLQERPHDWPEVLARLQSINWRRDNAGQWEGRALVGGKMSASRNNITLVTNEIKRVLGIPLSPEEQAAEEALARATSTISGRRA